ncbi:ABC transporter ATP-binding protein [Alkalicoccobacillus porphyridii]|nr:ABC transporter ATP-binding protein [Alkalicoccobacillus porphyridii]
MTLLKSIVSKVKVSFLLLMVLTLLQTGLSFGIPWINKILIDEILIGNQFQLIFFVVCAYLLFSIMSVILYMLVPRKSVFLNETITLMLRNALTRGVLYSNVGFSSSSNKGNIVNIYSGDIPNISSLITRTLKDLIEHSLTLVVIVSVLLFIDYRIGLLSLVSMPFYLLLPMLFRNKVAQSSKNVQEKQSEIHSIIHEGLNGLKQIKIFNKHEYFINRSKDVFESIVPLKLKHVFFSTASNATLLIYWISMLAVFWIGGSRVVAGDLSIGLLLILVNYMDRVEWPITRISQIITEYNSGKVSIKRFEKYTTVKKETEPTHVKDIAVINKISMNDICFKYPTSSANTFAELNWNISSGQRIGIIGESGIGKSTFIHLIVGFLEPDKGSIYFNNISSKELSVKSIREQIAYISQENYLFEVSIKENISFGSNKEHSLEEVMNAAKMAGAHSFIDELENKYDSIYGKDDTELSTGQKQRIALSRVFLKNPSVIILDEPTSNLDNQTTEFVIDSLINYCGDRKMLIVVTHDLHTLRRFDSILTLEDGEFKLVR